MLQIHFGAEVSTQWRSSSLNLWRGAFIKHSLGACVVGRLLFSLLAGLSSDAGRQQRFDPQTAAGLRLRSRHILQLKGEVGKQFVMVLVAPLGSANQYSSESNLGQICVYLVRLQGQLPGQPSWSKTFTFPSGNSCFFLFSHSAHMAWTQHFPLFVSRMWSLKLYLIFLYWSLHHSVQVHRRESF